MGPEKYLLITINIFILGLFKFSNFHGIVYGFSLFIDLSMKYGQIYKKIVIIVLTR